MAQKEMSFKDICYLELWYPVCSADLNHLSNGKRHHEEQFCTIILNISSLRYNISHSVKNSVLLHQFW